MQHEFKIVFDLYDETINENNEPILELIKKNVKKKWFVQNVTTISDIKEVISSKGNTLKNKCDVFSKTENKWVTVEGTYDNIKNIVHKEKTKIGYGI